MRQDTEIKFFLDPNIFLFPETDAMNLDLLQKMSHLYK
jgi:hypothetical protein